LKSEGSKEKTEVRKVEEKILREVTVKIGLEKIDTQEGITIEALLDSGATRLVMSSEFARKQWFKLKKLERPMNVRNVDGLLNKERSIEHTVEVNIYFKRHSEKMEIDVIGGQKWMVILGMPWLAYHNPEIDWRMGQVKMTRCLEECRKQWSVKIVDGRLCFYFLFSLYFIFRTTWVRVYQSRCHISHKLMAKSQD